MRRLTRANLVFIPDVSNNPAVIARPKASVETGESRCRTLAVSVRLVVIAPTARIPPSAAVARINRSLITISKYSFTYYFRGCPPQIPVLGSAD